MIPQIYKPNVDIPENMLFGIGEKKLGDKINFVVDYQVIEKTKSYVLLKVNSAYIDTNRRKF